MSKQIRQNAGGSVIAHRSLRFGWWSLAVFLTMGIVLEAFHGFKVGWYLEASNETRQFMLRLAHAHGTLLSVVNILFGLCLVHLQPTSMRRAQAASACLCGATIALPLGFLLGGIQLYGNDPGFGIALVPVGGLLLLIGVVLTATSLSNSSPLPDRETNPKR